MNEYCSVELLSLNSNTWNHLTVCKQISSGSFKNFEEQSIRLQIKYTYHMCMIELGIK